MAESPSSTAAPLTPEQVAAFTGGLVPAGTPGLSDMIDAALASIRRICGWHIFPVVEETLTLDAAGGRLLKLPTLRVEEVLSVKVRGEELDTDTYDWSRVGLIELSEGVFPDRYRSVEVTLRHGFEEVPDLLRVVAEIVRRGAMAGTGGDVRVGGISVGAPSGSGSGGGNVMPVSTEWRVIDQYKVGDWP